jgi:branched-chain amino acid transport system permease protein
MSDSGLLVLLSMLTTGILLGLIFALVASGVTIMYGCIWLPNASNGQFFVLAGLLAWTLTTDFQWTVSAAALAIVLVAGALAWLLEFALIRRLYDSPNRNIDYFVLTLGLTQIITGVFSLTYSRYSDQYILPPIVQGMTFIGPMPITNTRLVVILVAAITILALFAGFRFHRLGRAIRALFQNRDAAALRGVDVKSVYRLAFVLGTVITMLGGLLYAMAYSFDLGLAWTMSITAFAIMIVGGPGSILGALIVGLVFGFTQAAVSVVSTPSMATFAYLVAMLAILLIKPSGVFNR